MSKFYIATVFILFSFVVCGVAEEKPQPKPVELDVLKSSVGVWDAEIEVWPNGPDAPPVRFKGVETNQLFGEYWLASDFVSEFMGQTMKVHSIVGYDLDQKKLVGTIIDHGPYKATMTGSYDPKTKTLRWQIRAKDADGKPMLQRSVVTHKNANERLLVLMVSGSEKNAFTKMMQIRFVKKK
ncbi:MAG: hypothetical protein KatS3mg105_2366 [Gemmatales bacterium]|nr:MAG: hypothetical protein KatS3mg105_2366 [Gemmatales bacterium]